MTLMPKENIMNVSYIQSSPKFGDIEGNVADVVGRIKKLKTDLVVLPELFSTGYQFKSKKEARKLSETTDGYAIAELVKTSKETNTVICAGFCEKGGSTNHPQVYNSSVLITPQKGVVGVYRKTHLFWDEKKWFAESSNKFKVYIVKIGKVEVKIGMMICFDWYFPEVMRTLALKGAQIVCHPSNLVLPNCPDAMVTRSMENRVFSITANRVGSESRVSGKPLKFIGKSQITAPDGSILKRAPASCPSKKTSVGTVNIDLSMAKNKLVTSQNDLFKDRRVDLYFK